jgi:hypothetical protein
MPGSRFEQSERQDIFWENNIAQTQLRDLLAGEKLTKVRLPWWIDLDMTTDSSLH